MAKNKTLDGTMDVGCQRLLRHLAGQTEKNQEDLIIQGIQELYDEGLSGQEPKSPKQIAAKMLVAAMWQTEQKLRLPLFDLHGVDISKAKETGDRLEALMSDKTPEGQKAFAVAMQEEQDRGVVEDGMEHVVSEGFAGILQKGGFVSSYNGMRGGKFSQLLYGRSLRLIEATGDPARPVKFTNIPLDAAYRSTASTHLRHGDRPSQEFALVFKVPKSQFLSQFSDKLKEKKILPQEVGGFISRDGVAKYRNMDQKTTALMQEEEIEYAYFWKISDTPTKKKDWDVNDCGVMFRLVVGSNLTILDQQDGVKEYFWKLNGEPVFPVSERIAYKRAKGQFAAGIGHAVRDLATGDRKIVNLMFGNVYENTYPITFTGIPKGNEAIYQQAYNEAILKRSIGQPAIVPLVTDKDSGPIQSTSMRNGGDLNGAVALRREIELMLKRLGIHMDEMQGYAATATQAELDAQKQNNFIAYISEANQAETQFELELACEYIKKVKGGENIPLDVRVDYEGFSAKFLTLGMLRELLKSKHWFFVVDPASGEVPNTALRRQTLRENLQYMVGSPYAAQVQKELLDLSGVKVKNVDMTSPLAQSEGAQQNNLQ